MKTEDRVIRSIANRLSVVITRAELSALASPAQLTRALQSLIEKGKIVRVSQGVFAKTRINKFTGRPAPAGTLETISSELFKKLNIEVQPGRLAREYNEGRSTQVPMAAVVSTGRRKISRKITVGERTLDYEDARR